ncbi:MAG: anti-sigma factor [Planctomycetota bacterium]|jgi:hypothetical protein
MSREEFDNLLADALGGELDDERAARFQTLLDGSEEFHREYESLQTTLTQFSALAGPVKVSMADAFINTQGGESGGESPGGPAPESRTYPIKRPGHWMRYAASILAAFTCGYGAHAGLMLFADSDQGSQSEVVVDGSPAPDSVKESVEERMFREYRRNHDRPEFARCMVAMLGSRP